MVNHDNFDSHRKLETRHAHVRFHTTQSKLQLLEKPIIYTLWYHYARHPHLPAVFN